jgi:hypothetical protein
MHQLKVLACAAFVAAAASGVAGQWLTLPTPAIPRLPDGKPNLSAPAPRTADGKPDFSGLWQSTAGDRYFNNIAVDLQPGDVAPWADKLFKQRRLEFGKDSMAVRCLPLGPAYMASRYHMTRIIQTPALIAMVNDDDAHRTIFMDGRTLEADPNPTWMGYSVGRWEGDVLVVESNGYTDRSWLDYDGHPHTEELRITERYTRRDFGHLDVHVTMVDPKVYLKPITFTVPKEFQADTEMLEVVCENEQDRRRMTGKPAQPVDLPPAVLSRYVGVYDVDEQGPKHVVAVTLAGATLWIEYDGKGKEELVPLAPTRFSWSGAVVEFSAAAGGAVNMLIRYVEGDEYGLRRN